MQWLNSDFMLANYRENAALQTLELRAKRKVYHLFDEVDGTSKDDQSKSKKSSESHDIWTTLFLGASSDGRSRKDKQIAEAFLEI